jgi:Tol biopolymer transport system component
MKKMTKFKLCLIIFLVFFVIEVHAQEKAIERVVSEKLVTKIKEGYIKDSMAISPDNRHLAYLAVEKKFLGGVKWFVVLDGKEQKRYDYIGIKSLVFSPDSRRTAYVALSGKINMPGVREGSKQFFMRKSDIFSSDAEMFVVVDGEDEKHYNEVGSTITGKASDLTFFIAAPPVFSPDSKHLAYVAQEKGTGGLFVVVDDKKGKHYEWIGNLVQSSALQVGNPIFSPDSQHVAYVAQKAKKVFVVQDGNEGKQYDDIILLTFSPNGKHLAYAAKRGDKWLVVMDDKEDKEHDELGLLTFSPDSKHLAYRAQKDKKMVVVLDGEEEKLYDAVTNPLFSTDSKHLSYVAQEGKNFLMVVDKKEGKKYDAISFSPHSLFSPDSNHVAYGAQIGKEQFVVLDENENEKHYDRVDDFVFSPDGKRFAYAAVKDGKWFVVVDGKEEKKYDEVASLIFSPDSKRFAYAAFRDKKQFVVVNGVEGKQYDGIFKVGESGIAKFIFDSPDSFHYLAAEGNSVYLVEEIMK